MTLQHSPLKILTWHVHGSYLYYLTQTPCQFYLPVGLNKPGYGGRAGTFPWGENVHEIHVDEIQNEYFDVILFQAPQHYLEDQYTILSEDQRRSACKVYIEHDPPREHPTDTKHVVDDPHVLLVHVTHFNNLMWDNNRTPSTVIKHGVVVPEGVSYKGTKDKGIVVINNLLSRGRRLGLDVFKQIQKELPIDLVGMNAIEAGGIGEVDPDKITEFIADYRFFFYPVRYTSLGLALCEAMMVGMPIIGLATTELVTVIQNGYNGYVHTDPQKLIPVMKLLIEDKELAREWGHNAQLTAKEQFGIDRFARDWLQLFHKVTQRKNLDDVKYEVEDRVVPYHHHDLKRELKNILSNY